MSLSHRIALTCDRRHCKAEIVSGPLQFHGGEADYRTVEATARAAGWTRIEPVHTPMRTPDGEAAGHLVDGPWHYCPAHRPRRDTPEH